MGLNSNAKILNLQHLIRGLNGNDSFYLRQSPRVRERSYVLRSIT